MFEHAVALVGAWTILAPWVLGFAANDAATWTHAILGCVAIGSALAWLKVARKP